jgi:flagellar protein FlaF
MSARDTEIAAFRTVIRALENTGNEDSRIRAIGRNHELWSTLVKDLAKDGNGLDASLKTQLVALGLWAMRYSTLAILQNLPVEPLIEVNRNILDGLTLQAEQAPPPPPSSVQTAL